MSKLRNAGILLMMALLVTCTVVSCSKDGEDGDGPSISSISPSSALTGAEIVITGTNLSGSSVTIGGISTGVSNNTATSLTTSVPSGAATGSQQVKVTNELGEATSNITVTGAGAAPVITSITPGEVSAGGVITITGTGLSNAVVEIATKVATINSNTSTSITAVIPTPIALDQASVRVTTSLGTVVSTVIIK